VRWFWHTRERVLKILLLSDPPTASPRRRENERSNRETYKLRLRRRLHFTRYITIYIHTSRYTYIATFADLYTICLPKERRPAESGKMTTTVTDVQYYRTDRFNIVLVCEHTIFIVVHFLSRQSIPLKQFYVILKKIFFCFLRRRIYSYCASQL